MNDPTFLPAVEMARQIREKKLSPVELAEAYLDKIQRLNPKLNAYVHVDPERVRSEARAAEASLVNKGTLGPLHGVPIAIKDFTPTEGKRTTKSSKGTRLY